MSNAPMPPSPRQSRPRPGYGGYQPSHGNAFYGSSVPNTGRLRGDSWRAQPSYRPRDPHADHYEPDYDGDKPRFGWPANYYRSQCYDPSSEPWSRRDIMAERMFEPSESWKHDHVPEPGLVTSERFANRMPPPREDYMYSYGGDSYRTGPSYISRRDSALPRQPDLYRPGYLDEGRWNSSYPLDDTSNSWARQQSPSTSRPSRGRLDYRDVSYENSLSGSPRSSRFSSPRHSRVAASRMAQSPSSSSIRSSRERSKSPQQSHERSPSSVRSSADSHSYTTEPPAQPLVQRSHPVGQFRGRRRGGPRSGMRFPADSFRDSTAPPLVPPLAYPNELGLDDHLAPHPSLPLRPSPPYLTPGPSGRNRFPERGISGPTQSRYNDSQASRGGYQVGRSKRKRRGGVNRKKRGTFHPQAGPARDILSDSNATPLPLNGLVVHVPSPFDEVDASRGLFISAVPDPQTSTSLAAEAPVVMSPEPEIEPSSAEGNQSPHSAALQSEEEPKSEVSVPVIADASPAGGIGDGPSLQDAAKSEYSPMAEVVRELPRLVIPPSKPPVEPQLAQDGLHKVNKTESPSQCQSVLFSPVPAGVTTAPLSQSEPSLEQCSTLQSLPISGLPEVTTSSPVSSAAPTPSLQTPSPPYVPPGAVVATPMVEEAEDVLMPASPVSSALHAIGVPAIVLPDRDTFSAHNKEAESLTEALHMVVSARQRLDLQSREERVNPILMSNSLRAVAASSPDAFTPSADTLVQEVLAGQHTKDTIQAFESHTRGSLIANMATRQEAVEEKVARLRREYLALHREWVVRCAELDNSHRVDPAGGEVSAIPTRTTRRSAAVLGDAVRSDLEMEQIIASLGNDELYDPAHLALRNLAVIPDMISVTRGKVDAVFDDTNDTVNDTQSFFDPSPSLAEWTDDEVEIYKQRFAKYPKQFGHIAAGLVHKTQAQCVQFYYLHKKVLIDFREAIATYGQSKSKRRRGGRKTDKKKGGLLADIRQHDAEVSKEQDPVKRRAGAAARRRRESARTAPRRSITAVLQEEQTPLTTPTPEPEPESARPKRRRNIRPVAEPEPVGTDEPPPKRSRRTRKPKLVPDTSTLEPKPLSKTAIEPPNAHMEDIGMLMELLGKDLKRIAASMPSETTTQGVDVYAPADPSQEKKNSSESIRDTNHERSFAISDVPPISATSRSHLMDPHFSIPGSSSGSTLRLFS